MPDKVKNEKKKKDKVEVVEKEKAKKNHFLEFFVKEYRYENLILVVLAIFAIVLGCLIVVPYENGGTAVLAVSTEVPIIGIFEGKLFAGILIGLGAISVLLVAWPFYKPSFQEVKHIKGLKRSEYLLNIARVLIFIVVLIAFFFLCDLGLDELKSLVINS